MHNIQERKSELQSHNFSLDEPIEEDLMIYKGQTEILNEEIKQEDEIEESNLFQLTGTQEFALPEEVHKKVENLSP